MYGTDLPDPVKVISIGAVTTKTAETLGIPVFATAKEATAEGIAACVLQDCE